MSLASSSVRTNSGRVLTVLYKEHAGDAFRYALHLTGRRADAEDIVQQVFLQAHRHLESGRELVSPRAWLLTAVKHRAFNLTRDRREVPVDRPIVPVEAPDASGDEAAQLAEVRGMLWTLPEAQHHAFVLRHWSGLSQNEIADVLETTPTAVESLLSRARSALLRAHDTASDACSQVRHRLLESTELGGSDVAHLGACRPCRHAHDRLTRAANVAGALALVPGAHVAHAIADLVPGFSAHAATSTAAAIGTTSGAGAGASRWGRRVVGHHDGCHNGRKGRGRHQGGHAVVATTAVVGTSLPPTRPGRTRQAVARDRPAASHPASPYPAPGRLRIGRRRRSRPGSCTRPARSGHATGTEPRQARGRRQGAREAGQAGRRKARGRGHGPGERKRRRGRRKRQGRWQASRSRRRKPPA